MEIKLWVWEEEGGVLYGEREVFCSKIISHFIDG